MNERLKRLGAARNLSGREGERFVGSILKRVLRDAVPLDRKGADFLLPGRRGKKPLFVEVKSTSDIRPGKRIILKTRDGKWVNNVAHHVIIVTNDCVYFTDAGSLRRYVAENFHSFHSFKQMRARRRTGIVNIHVPVDRLEEEGVAAGISRGRLDKIAKTVREMTGRESLPAHTEISRRADSAANSEMRLAVKAIPPAKKFFRPIIIPFKGKK